MPVCVNFALLFSGLLFFFGGQEFLLASSASGQARHQSVQHDACLDPDRAPWPCCGHPTSLSGLLFPRGSLDDQVQKAEEKTRLFCNSPFPSRIFPFTTPSRPPYNSTSLIVLPCMVSATMQQQQQQYSFVTARTVLLCVRVCASVYVWVGGVLA